jgi:hypothetical protein
VRLQVTLRGDGGSVQGKVLRKQEALPGVLVILAPLEDSADPADYHLFVSDGDGSFDFTGVRPGAYHLFASDLPELEYANPSVLRPLRKWATRAEVEANRTCTADLALTPRSP